MRGSIEGSAVCTTLFAPVSRIHGPYQESAGSLRSPPSSVSLETNVANISSMSGNTMVGVTPRPDYGYPFVVSIKGLKLVMLGKKEADLAATSFHVSAGADYFDVQRGPFAISSLLGILLNRWRDGFLLQVLTGFLLQVLTELPLTGRCRREIGRSTARLTLRRRGVQPRRRRSLGRTPELLVAPFAAVVAFNEAISG